VNWQHFRAFVWLRWRLFANQQRRAGKVGIVIGLIVAVLALGGAAVLAVTMFFVGLYGMKSVSPTAILFTWDGLAAGFLMFWLIGLIAELQRAEALSLDKFLHLPVSLSSAFVINYLASLIRASFIFFVPAMLGLSLGLVFSRGPAMLLLFPLLAAFLLSVSALTYQFQGWLAALMSNPRRRRTVIVVATATIILVAQLPNLLNLAFQRQASSRPNESRARLERWDELNRAVQEKTITQVEFARRKAELDRETNEAKEKSKQEDESAVRTAELVNAIVPPGWLPYGAMSLAEGNVLPALLGILGLGLFGSASLWRAYRTTLRIYTGNVTKRRPAGAAGRAAPEVPPRPAEPTKTPVGAAPTFLERHVPGLSEQTAAIALAGFRGLVRAPEAKMMLLSPIIMLLVFGSMFLTRPGGLAESTRPWVATGAIAMILIGMGQLFVNQFGFDRAGFRVFVLCSARRGDILLGKNLSFAPLAVGFCLVALIFLEIVYPMRADLFLAALPQAVTMFLLYCLAANLLSILAPMPIAAGSLRPANTRFTAVLLQFAFMFGLPILWSPALLPFAADSLLDWADIRHGLPVALVLSVAICAGVIVIYRLALNWQGDMLQAREQDILNTVTSQVE
jgi:ABC-2 type transport system permease protein